jgi:hypothetical protein
MKEPWRDLEPVLALGDEGMVDRAEGVVAGCYGPGLVCMVCARQTLHVGLILREERADRLRPVVRYRLVGMDCAAYLGVREVALWREEIEEEVAFGGALCDEARREAGRRKLIEVLELICLLEENRFARAMRQRLREGQPLSQGQVRRVREMKKERGNLAGMRRRRDLAHRLARLAEVELAPEDEEKVRSLARQNVSWRKQGQMYLLSEKQRRLISALEEKYLDQRLENTARWVDRLAQEWGL